MISFINDTQNSHLKLNQELDVSEETWVQQQEEIQFEPKEFFFIIDWSGSMSGKPIEVAKEALKLLIRSLPIGS